MVTKRSRDELIDDYEDGWVRLNALNSLREEVDKLIKEEKESQRMTANRLVAKIISEKDA